MKGLVWFKNDLRLHDNEALCQAISSAQELLFVYCVDKRLFDNLNLGFKKAGYNRFQFLRQSVLDLQQSLEAIGGHLHIITGIPEVELPELIRKYKISAIYGEMEYAPEELAVVNAVQKSLKDEVQFNMFWGKTLYHIDDIPFTIPKIPLTSKAYRIPTSKEAEVRAVFKAPAAVIAIQGINSNEFPDEDEFAFAKAQVTKTESENYKPIAPYIEGGETAGLRRLNHYSFETQQLTNYRWTRNRSLGMEYSSKFSPYLALGCLSPRLIYEYVKEYERTIKKNQSTWWIVFELVWRDYFTFKGMRIGNSIFHTEGFRKKDLVFDNNNELFSRWCDGMTGIPFVDAHMRQLNQTGYMSNRGRVNCSSFLVHDYKIDWTWGASYFESKLIDYDVSANWMNWHMQAYEIWYTNPVHQSLKYKANDFIKKWIPELNKLEDNHIHAPWLLENQPDNYPKPIEVYIKWSRSVNNIKKSLNEE